FSSAPRSPASERVVDKPPELKERFLGVLGTYSGKFDRKAVLAAGPGTIAGTVKVDGKPAQGLRLRLVLNEGVMSQWADNDAPGRYVIPVPYGKYRIDGYELGYDTAGAVLAGKNDSPLNHRFHRGEPFIVAEGKPGPGLDLAYVAPVVKIGPKGAVSGAKPI